MRWIRRSSGASALGVLLALAFCAAAGGSTYNITELVSTGPIGGSEGCNACFVVASPDASRIFFSTREALVPEDTQTDSNDVYLRQGGTTTLISTGAFGKQPEWSNLKGGSEDASRVFFETSARLLPEDLDTQQDVYQWENGTLTLLTTGPIGGNGPFFARFSAASKDGSRVFFTTDEKLVPEDIDSSVDLYERAGGTTTLLSTGSIGGNGAFPVTDYPPPVASEDGTHVFFTTTEALEPDDLDTGRDVYERTAGMTKLVSTGPSASISGEAAYLEAISADGTHAFFSTQEALVSADTIPARAPTTGRTAAPTSMSAPAAQPRWSRRGPTTPTLRGPVCRP